MHIRFDNINEVMPRLARILLTEGKTRGTRGFECVEIPQPITITLNNPTNRCIRNKARGWNKFLGFAESLWLLSGVNHMDMVGSVVKNLYNFSDDKQFMRAGYGPRLRGFTGVSEDYNHMIPTSGNAFANSKVQESGYNLASIDQLKYVVEVLQKDPNSRQASITIHDPAKDCYNTDGTLKTTKDQPCTRLIQFMMVDGKLDATTYMRSNDFLWGFSAVNVFNFTVLQEVVAGLLGVRVGKYHHIANNLHYYKEYQDKVEAIANEVYNDDYKSFHYNFRGITLDQLDKALKTAYTDASLMASGTNNPYFTPTLTGVDIVDDMVSVISRKFQGVQDHNENFINPLIEDLFNE